MSALQQRCSRIFRVLLLAMNVLPSILLLPAASMAQTVESANFQFALPVLSPDAVVPVLIRI